MSSGKILYFDRNMNECPCHDDEDPLNTSGVTRRRGRRKKDEIQDLEEDVSPPPAPPLKAHMSHFPYKQPFQPKASPAPQPNINALLNNSPYLPPQLDIQLENHVTLSSSYNSVPLAYRAFQYPGLASMASNNETPSPASSTTASSSLSSPAVANPQEVWSPHPQQPLLQQPFPQQPFTPQLFHPRSTPQQLYLEQLAPQLLLQQPHAQHAIQLPPEELDDESLRLLSMTPDEMMFEAATAVYQELLISTFPNYA